MAIKVDFDIVTPEIKNRLKDMGFTPSSVNSKLVAAMCTLFQDEKNPVDAFSSFEHMCQEVETMHNKQCNMQKKLNEFSRNITKQAKEIKDKEDKLADLLELETAEAKDRLRMAILYQDMIDVSSSYDNTAYIKGLAAIMSGNTLDKNEK